MPSEPTAVAPVPLLVDVKGASAILCIGTRTVWALAHRGAIPNYRIGRSVRYCPDELRAWKLAGCPTDDGAGDAVRKAVRP